MSFPTPDPEHTGLPTPSDDPRLLHRRSLNDPKPEDIDSNPQPTQTPAVPSPGPPTPRTWARALPLDTLRTPGHIVRRRILIAAVVLAAVLLLALLTSALVLRRAMHASLPPLDGHLAVAGLTAPVTVTRDPQAVPSIHASNLDDLLFAQGYITASDRLFQMDALRRHGAGTLAEILGPALIPHDREQRILQLRSAADRAIAVLPADQLHQLRAYANGVNAFINTHDGSALRPNTLPIEFHILDYTPTPWLPRDSLLIALVMAQDLATNFPSKLNREALSAHLPANLLADLYPIGSWRDHPPTQTPTDLTTPTAPIEQIPLDRTQSSCADGGRSLVPIPAPLAADGRSILASSPHNAPHLDRRPGSQTANSSPQSLPIPLHPTLTIARVPHPSRRFTARWVGWTMPNSPGATPSQSASELATPHDLLATYTSLREGLSTAYDPTLAVRAGLRAGLCGCRSGSNNWVVSGSHTATGAPLLSNDMHLGLTAPDIWYEASLHVDPHANPPAATSPSITQNPTLAVRAGLRAGLRAVPGPPLNVTGFTLPGVPFVIVGRNPFVSWGFTNSGADVQDVLIEHLRGPGSPASALARGGIGHGSSTEYERSDHTWAPVGHHLEHIAVRFGRDVTLDVLTTTHTVGATTLSTPIISPLYPSEHRALALAWTIYDPSTVTSPFLAINTATDAASLVAAFAGFASVSQNLVYADAHHIGYHLLGRIPIRGPALHRPRSVTPFILPNDTPSEDDQDESGDPTAEPGPNASLIAPHPNLVIAPHPDFVIAPHPNLVIAPHTDLVISTGVSRLYARRSGETPVFALASLTQTLSSRPKSALFADAVERPAAPATESSSRPQPVTRGAERGPRRASLAQRGAATRSFPATTAPAQDQPSPSAQDSAQNSAQDYTIGSPISPIPVDALDPTQAWSGYIPYDQLPSVLDPASGIIATANARIVTDTYPFFIANDWANAYRVERISRLLTSNIANGNRLTPADMLAIQNDIHSEFDLLLAQRLAYALDHSALTKKDPRLQQAANLLRDWNGNVTAGSSAAAIVSATHDELWPMLLAPQLRAYAHPHHALKRSPSAQDSARDSAQDIDLYTWDERTSALEQILQHTPARWLPHKFSNWDDFLTTAVERGLHANDAPRNLSTWTFGSGHPIDIPHPVFGSHSPLSTLLGVATGSGFHPRGGDGTTIDAAGLHFGPSERFTADLSNPDDTHANITTGESGNPSSSWFLDQFLPWLNGTTFTLPLDHPPATHTLTLTP